MKFAIDCRRIQPGMTGLGSYTLGLVSAMAFLVREERHDLVLFVTPESVPFLSEIIENITIIKVQWPVENHWQGEIWKHLSLPKILNNLSIDLFHDPAYQLPVIRSRAANVVTIHDLVPFRYPETNTLKYNLYWRNMTRAAIRRADRIIAVSEFTRFELENSFPAACGRVDVVPEAASSCFKPAPPNTDILHHFGIKRPYFMTTAKYEPRKNLARCIEAFMAGPATVCDDIQLVIAGAMGWKNDTVESLINAPDVCKRIIVTGYLQQAHLVEIMRGATALVIPSVYEGFGLPVLEGMASGVPVICSGVASLPEVGGDAAMYFDPFQVSSIAEVMTEIMMNEVLRKELKVKGLARAATYSWKTAAEKTLDTYIRTVKAGRKK